MISYFVTSGYDDHDKNSGEAMLLVLLLSTGQATRRYVLYIILNPSPAAAT